MRYQSQRRVPPELVEDQRHVAMERPRFGYRRLHVMLRRKGWRVNKKLVLRLVRENDWLVRRRQRKKLAAVPRIAVPAPSCANEAWAMDFVFDGTAGGRTLRTLNVVERFTRECLVIEVDTSITGRRVVAVLALLVAMRGKPQSIRVDNGPEFISKTLDAWAFEQGISLHFIRPGKPIENAHVESFNGKLRDECLNQNWFCRSRRREGEDRALEEGLQRGQAAQLAGLPDADGVHQQTAGSCLKGGLNPGSRSSPEAASQLLVASSCVCCPQVSAKQVSSCALLQHPPKPKRLVSRAPLLRVRTHCEVTSAMHDPFDVFPQFLKSLFASCNGQQSIVLI
jgi:putative transposase